MRLHLDADELLSTTRSVRRRLDFGRSVDRAVLMECLELAIQAPSASNHQQWQWMFVDDAASIRQVGAWYLDTFESYGARPSALSDDERAELRQESVMSSARYLAENLHRAPVLMIPMFTGRLDGLPADQAATRWGTLLPAAWSFMLALRERGLGSAWTTLHLKRERDVAALLGIPYEQYTQGGLFPIAYTLGTDFKRAPRRAAEQVVHWNRWGER